MSCSFFKGIEILKLMKMEKILDVYHSWNLSTKIHTRIRCLGIHLLMMQQKSLHHGCSQNPSIKGQPSRTQALVFHVTTALAACSLPDALNILTSSSPWMAEQRPYKYNKTYVSRNIYNHSQTWPLLSVDIAIGVSSSRWRYTTLNYVWVRQQDGECEIKWRERLTEAN